ncbi:hypothetical protein ACFXJO_25055 [Streptomyces lavendulae]|uniref:hypothetical protein n=1 Tax=Streptomyces lavendulae TaxID=1914 RepID=UPI0036A7B91D
MTLPIVLAAMAMAASVPSAQADERSGDTCISSDNRDDNGSNACRYVFGAGHVTGSGQTGSGKGKLATQRIESPPVRLLPGASTSLSLPCPEGTLLLGGGWKVTPEGDTATPVILESHPDDDDTRWLVTVQNAGSAAFSIQVVNQCTKPSV